MRSEIQYGMFWGKTLSFHSTSLHPEPKSWVAVHFEGSLMKSWGGGGRGEEREGERERYNVAFQWGIM